MKKLRRSKDDRMIAGVCGGVGEYFDIDPTLVRLGAVGLSIIAWRGFPLVYLLMAIVMPVDDGITTVKFEEISEPEPEADTESE